MSDVAASAASADPAHPGRPSRSAPTPEAFERAVLQPPRDGDGRAEREDFLAWVSGLVHARRLGLAGVARHEGLGPEDSFDAVQEAFQTFLTMPEARPLLERPDESR